MELSDTSTFDETWSVIVFVENIVFIDVKYRQRLHMSNINIARWRLLKILFCFFDARFRYPIFKGIFTLNT